MKRIFVVDDEYLVRLGLKTIIDWAAFGYTIAGEAGNGREALDFLEKNTVDVVLTDIKMPVMDGLELTRKIREKDKQIQIIILSHYDEFSYAQEAIKLGAFRYILKSELTKTNLENVLKSLHFSFNDGEAKSDGMKSAEPGAADQSFPPAWKEQCEAFIQEHILPSFLRPLTDEEEPWEHLFPPVPPAAPTLASASASPSAREASRSPAETGRCVLFSVSCRVTSLQNDARNKFPKTIAVLFDEAFDNFAGKGRYYDDNFHFAAIVFPEKLRAADHGRPEIPEKIEYSCMQIVKNVYQYYDVHVFIGVSSAGDPRSWRQLLFEAHKARVCCFFASNLFVNVFHKLNDSGISKKIKTGNVIYTKLVVFFDTNQKDAMLEYIGNIFAGLRAGKNHEAVHEAFIDFLSVGKLIHEKYQLKEEASLSENKFKHDAFFDLPFIGDVEKYIYELYLSLFSTKQNGEASYSHIVKKCIDFIHSGYQNNIGLSEAAEKIGVSHSYLSFIFKQETGINFNAALAQYRIEKAKNLLAATGLRIYQVAEQVGFSNPYYFSKVFREISGYTCKEYRDKGESADSD